MEWQEKCRETVPATSYGFLWELFIADHLIVKRRWGVADSSTEKKYILRREGSEGRGKECIRSRAWIKMQKVKVTIVSP